MEYWAVGSSGWGLPLAPLVGLGQIALVIVLMVIVFLAIALQFLHVRELYGSGGSATPDQQVNCSSCGARTAAKADTCEYCGGPID